MGRLKEFAKDNYVDESEPILRKSLVKAMRRCPQQAKYQFIDDLEVEPNKYMKRGTRIHDIYDEYFDNVSLSKLSETENKFEYIYSKLPDGDPFEFFANYESNRFKELKNKLNYMPILKEEQMRSTDLRWTGKPDRLDVLEPGTYETYRGKEVTIDNKEYVLIDYKTGEFKEYKLTDLNFELTFYAVLISDIFDKEPKFIMGMYPDSEKIYFNTIHGRTLNSLERRIKKTRKHIKNDNYPKNIGLNCMYCSFLDRCSENWALEDYKELKDETN